MADQPEIWAANRKYVSPSFKPDSDTYYKTIQSAIADIPLNSSDYPDEPWTVFVYPGEYAESVVLMSNISVVGSGIQSTIIKGNGTAPAITGPSTDGGGGECFICNLTVDGAGRSAITFLDSLNAKSSYVVDVQLVSSNPTGSDYAAMTVGNNQLVRCFNLHCNNTGLKDAQHNDTKYYLYETGIAVTGNGNLRAWHSQVMTFGNCLVQSGGGETQYSEFYHCFLSSGSTSMNITSGRANIYNCQTVGGIYAWNSGTLVKHVNSFHDGHISAINGATMWVSGMKWGEWLDNPSGDHNIDIIFELSGGSKAVVSNSRAGTQAASYVAYVGSGCTFKAFNSEFNQLSAGDTITGDDGLVVFLYYCTFEQAG